MALWTELEPFPEPPIVRTRYPVIFLHGLGTAALMVRRGMFYQIAMYLRQHLIWAFCPNVTPYGRIEQRAAEWKTRIERILALTGAERANLIAHSMGGLDGRYLISKLGMGPQVATLTTIATPHRGTSLAEYALEQPKPFQKALVALYNWVGSKLYRHNRGEVLAAIGELTREFVQNVFNPEVPDRPEVRYFSFAGAAGKGTDTPISPFLLWFNGLIYEREGLNDGMVSVASSRWGDFQGVLPADHAQQLGIRLGTQERFDPYGFYLDWVRKLAEMGY
ncbi:MAG: hypothetical protein N2561_07510 [Bacteroidetes bacterium]|nr:hypothetical protein [Rhodothermia bacterium]MCS7155542.1 hypothetical protein [Bacteroidota bacterium]MCX7907365.1 hypothetical protein [Bacteroidota bacterium]MDW8138359.1 hypothetical protein [Bacteroidota bacterium]MDW8284704.1 hypothetical protein [Bacteroidota bacterium]